MPRKRYDTPHRSRVVKTRMTEEEYADFAARLAPYGISQSEFIRRAIQGASIRFPGQRRAACRAWEADRRIRQDRQQPQSDRPRHQRLAQSLSPACGRGAGGSFRSRRFEV